MRVPHLEGSLIPMGSEALSMVGARVVLDLVAGLLVSSGSLRQIMECFNLKMLNKCLPATSRKVARQLAV